MLFHLSVLLGCICCIFTSLIKHFMYSNKSRLSHITFFISQFPSAHVYLFVYFLLLFSTIMSPPLSCDWSVALLSPPILYMYNITCCFFALSRSLSMHFSIQALFSMFPNVLILDYCCVLPEFQLQLWTLSFFLLFFLPNVHAPCLICLHAIYGQLQFCSLLLWY